MTKRYGKLFFYVAGICFLVSSIPVIMFYTVIRQGIIKDYEEKILEINKHYLQSSMDSTDRIFLEAYNGATQVASTVERQDLGPLMSRPSIESYNEVARFKNVQHVLFSVSLNFAAIEDNYLYYPDYDRILSDRALFYTDMYPGVYNWLREFDTSDIGIHVFSVEDSIKFIIPVSSLVSGSNALYVVEINTHNLIRSFANSPMTGSLFIFNRSNDLIYQEGKIDHSTSWLHLMSYRPARHLASMIYRIYLLVSIQIISDSPICILNQMIQCMLR